MDVKQICRTCESTTYLLLVDSIPDLHSDLKKLLDLEPLPDPEAICTECIKILRDFKEFKRNCHTIDARIRGAPSQPPANCTTPNFEGFAEETFHRDVNFIQLMTTTSYRSGGEKTHECENCHQFFDKSGYLKHQKNTKCTPNANLSAKESEDDVKTDQEEVDHEVFGTSKKSDRKPLKCDKCHNTFSSISHLNRHKTQHCAGVSSEFSSLSDATFEMPIDELTKIEATDPLESSENKKIRKRFKCQNCQKAYKSVITLMCHQKECGCPKNESSQKPLADDTIDSETDEAQGDSTNECVKCLKTFSTKSNLRRHEKKACLGIPAETTLKEEEKLPALPVTLTNKERTTLECAKCHVQFSNTCNLRRHKSRNCPPKKLFSCNECGKSFTLPIHYENHMKKQ